jgi:aerobic-type carbon monoxide dehydrogenase small subunit (CoxS/CutS family)
MELKVIVNNEEKSFQIKAGEHLLDILRREGYHSIKEGCREGTCGSCVVLLDGKAVNSCLVLAAHCQDRKITTVEGIGTLENPHPLQEAFVKEGAVQCGYCTPGMLLSSKALLDENPDPGPEEIKRALDGNLCRCTGYVKIVSAVQKAAKKMRKKSGKKY